VRSANSGLMQRRKTRGYSITSSARASSVAGIHSYQAALGADHPWAQ
jgi:hypothetical protein